MRHITSSHHVAGQRGLTLIIVLVALVSLSLAAVALIRSVDTSTLILGNLAFKQGTTLSTDRSAEAGMTWLAAKLGGAPTELYENRCVSGCQNADSTTAYYATSLDALDITGHSTETTRIVVDWDDDNCAYAPSRAQCLKASPAVVANDYATRYVIMRMCKTEGPPSASGNNCAKPTTGTVSNRQINKGETRVGATTSLGGNVGGGSDISVLVFRIVVRSKGPRNTVSFTETFVNAVGS